MSNEEPRYLGHYVLLECLAYGGMGEVWKALDTKLNRTVAIKLLRSEWRRSSDFVARFQSEAQLIASLNHPNIVKIHNFHVSEEAETPLMYMVMDYVQGQTLADYIRETSGKGQFPSPSDIVYIFTTVGLALDYAHAHDMIHRDIKPANILLDQRRPTAHSVGEPVLSDFGIARRQGVSGGTIVGSIVGTPLYVSPEQAQGNYDDKRSDLYSLGIILYEMMTGVTPFRNAAPMALLVQHIYDTPTPPELINSHISPELSAVILKSIAKKPEDRFPTASALSTALAQALHVSVSVSVSNPQTGASAPTMDVRPFQPSFQPSFQPPVPTTKASGSFFKSRLFLILLSALLLIVLGSGIAAFAFSTRQAQPDAVVGQLHFSSSGPASKPFDTLQIDIQNIPPPPAGKVYVAWIDQVTNESNHPHWQLQPDQNNSIHATHLTYPSVNNLLLPDSLFVVTLQDAGTTPLVPSVIATDRLYYARLDKQPAPVLDLHKCPGDPNSTVCL